MKYILLISAALGLMLSGCSNNRKSKVSFKTDSVVVESVDNSSSSKDEITGLIRQMLKWGDSKQSIDLLPVLVKDSICIGFNMDKLEQNNQKLKQSGFFADEFIDNYDHIIQTLDKKIKSKEFEPWNIGELPTFSFASDSSPWCSCQDNLSWDKVEVEVIKLNGDKGELKWNWGKLDPGTDPSWERSATKFDVAKVDGKWKIAYLQGFDYKEGVKP